MDARLPLDEPYRIPESTAAAIRRAKAKRGQVVAVGTTGARDQLIEVRPFLFVMSIWAGAERQSSKEVSCA